MTKREKDNYLKSILNDTIKKIEELCYFGNNGQSITYYSGNFLKDVRENFNKKDSDNLFKRMSRYLNDNRLVFLQKKIKNTEYFDYTVTKR